MTVRQEISPTPGINAARQLAHTYGTHIHTHRTQHKLTLRTLATITGIPAGHLSEIERGLRIPTPSETDELAQSLHLPNTNTPVFVDHARMTDPPSSDTTVKSVVTDRTLRELIVDYANQIGRPFDDTDLVEHVRRYKPRAQRNVIARARGRVETEPNAPFVRVGALERFERGTTLKTVHYTKETN